MKKLFTTMMIASAALCAQAQTQPDQEKKAEIQFVDDSHDFGNIKEGTQATYEFKFKNTGSIDLILSDVKASCGCTTPEWPREPIAPGASGVIKASYNSTGRPGPFNKSITVTANTAEKTKVITIRGNVEANAVNADVAPPPLPTPDVAPQPTVITAPAPSAPPVTVPAGKNIKTTKPMKPTLKKSTKPVVKPAVKTEPKVQPKS